MQDYTQKGFTFGSEDLLNKNRGPTAARECCGQYISIGPEAYQQRPEAMTEAEKYEKMYENAAVFEKIARSKSSYMRKKVYTAKKKRLVPRKNDIDILEQLLEEAKKKESLFGAPKSEEEVPVRQTAAETEEMQAAGKENTEERMEQQDSIIPQEEETENIFTENLFTEENDKNTESGTQDTKQTITEEYIINLIQQNIGMLAGKEEHAPEADNNQEEEKAEEKIQVRNQVDPDEFIAKFKRFENALRDTIGQRSLEYEQAQEQELQEKLKYCRITRNYIQHQDNSDGFAIPSVPMMELLDEQIGKLEACFNSFGSIAEPVASVRYNATIKETAQAMKENRDDYAGLAVVLDDNGRPCGVITSEMVTRAVSSATSLNQILLNVLPNGAAKEKFKEFSVVESNTKARTKKYGSPVIITDMFGKYIGVANWRKFTQ